MSAQNTTGLNSNTQYDLSDGNETTYTGNWLSSNTVTRSSYTNHSGITRYYFNIPGNSDLRTASNTSDAASIIANGGFTMWFTLIPYNNRSSWSRLFNYFQLANGSSGTGISSTSQYHGPLLFFNRNSNQFEYRRPSNTASNGDPAQITGVNNGTGVTVTIVIRQLDTSTSKVWVIRNGTSVYSNQSLSHSGTGGYGIKNVQNNALPVFVDSIYNSTQFNGVMESGFANRPYSVAECGTLATALDNKYRY